MRCLTLLLVAALSLSSSAAWPNDSDYYTNVNGHRVHRPERSERPPLGAAARCRDGTWISEHRTGTCSHHGGVASWLR